MKILVVLMATAMVLLASNPVVSAEWVSVYQKDKTVVIVDVSAPEAYAQSHIPGAINSPLKQWRMPVDRHAEVRPVEALQAEMRRLGINKDSKVVVYAHNLNPKDLLKATYVIWAMEYAGFDNTVLLDGGLPSYVQVTGMLSKKPEADRGGNFRAHEKRAILAKINEVKGAVGRVQMVDSRPAIYYFGAERQGVLDRAGHISGAKSYFWRYSLDDEWKFKPKKVLRQMLETGMGLRPNAPLIVYCTGGLQASMNYFVLHRILGFKDVKLYDASMKAWANREDTPMTVFKWQ